MQDQLQYVQSNLSISIYFLLIQKVSKVDLNYLEATKYASFITNVNSKLQTSGNTGKKFAPSGDFTVQMTSRNDDKFDGEIEPRSTVRHDRKVRSSGFCLGEPENQGTGSQWYQSDCAMLRMGVYPIRGVCLHP